LILAGLFVMGMGMGSTMMPIMSSALRTLSDHMIARGSTLMNIVQQVASSVGTAIMSVVLTNQILDSQLAGPAIAARSNPSIAAQLPPGAVEQGLSDVASAFATTFTLALVLLGVTFLAAFLLPRRQEAVDDPQVKEPVLVH
jgi:hypothetical protein